MTTTLSAMPVARRSAADLLWQGLAGRRAGLLLVAAFIVALAVGNLLPQLPPDAAADVAERTRWLVTTSLAYGRWGTLFQRLGLFDVAHAPWWEGLLALGFGYALLRLADALERAGRWAGRRIVLPAALPDAVHVADTDETLAAVRARLDVADGTVTAQEGAPDGGDGATVWRIVQHPRAVWAQPVAWLGVALLLLWGLLGEQGAWRVGSLSLPPGQLVPLGQGTGLSLRLDGDRVVWRQGDVDVASTRLADGQPATYRGIGLHRRSTGPTLTVMGKDAAGSPLTFTVVGGGQAPGEAAHLVFDRDDERTFAVTATGLAFRVVVTPDGAYQVEAYHSGEERPFFTTTLTAAGTVRIEQADYAFTPAQFVRVTAQYTPYFPLLPVAGALVAVGVGLHLARPARALWLRATPTGKGVWLEWATERGMPDGWLRDLLAEGARDG